MKTYMKDHILFWFLMIGIAFSATAQDLVYEPVNPAFGGETFNYQWLLNSAQTQNTIEEEGRDDRFSRDPLSDFESSLNRQILSELSRSLIASQFGEDGIQEGMYILGDYRIDITQSPDGIEVIILDEATGNQTTVVIPYF